MCREELLLRIQEVQMMCVDLNLFLDTHPYDERALYDFNCYCEQLETLKEQYECHFGPLENFGNSQADLPFSWQQTPWPWE